jgi:hypothetical protein
MRGDYQNILDSSVATPMETHFCGPATTVGTVA